MSDARKGLLLIIITLGVLSGVCVGDILAVRNEASWIVGVIAGAWIGMAVGLFASVLLSFVIYLHEDV